jgi:hypothetical protein
MDYIGTYFALKLRISDTSNIVYASVLFLDRECVGPAVLHSDNKIRQAVHSLQFGRRINT